MRSFLLIFGAGLGSALVGAGLGWLIGLISPEFISLVTQPTPVADAPRLGTVLGLLSGLLLGSAAMSFGILVEAFRAWATRGRGSEEPRPVTLAPESRTTDLHRQGRGSTAVQRPEPTV